MDRKEVNEELANINDILADVANRLGKLAESKKDLGKFGYMIDEANADLGLTAARLRAFLRHSTP
jgi:hypothetical protein